MNNISAVAKTPITREASTENLPSYPAPTAPIMWEIVMVVPYQALDACLELENQQNTQGMCWGESALHPTLEDVVDENGFPVSSAFEIAFYFGTKPDRDIFQCAVDCIFELLSIPELAPRIEIEKIDDQDWVSVCYNKIPPQTFGHFYIFGSHVTDIAPEDTLIPVCIDAATAFGSGDHPTTEGCLHILTHINSFHKASHILDMGCGSGILGISAKKQYPDAHVTLVDIDPEAVRVATDNALRNQVNLDVFEGSGFENTPLTKADTFDLIFANILAKPLCELASEFAKHTKEGAIVIVSGLLIRQGDLVKEYYIKEGFKVIEEMAITEWLSIAFQKENT